MLLLKCCCITCEIWGAYIWSNQRYYLLSKGCLEFLLLCCKSSNFQNAVSESAFFSLNSCRYSWLFPKLLSSKAWIFVFQGDTFFFFFSTWYRISWELLWSVIEQRYKNSSAYQCSFSSTRTIESIYEYSGFNLKVTKDLHS